VKYILKDVINETFHFAKNKIKEGISGDNYKEFLDLIINLGSISPRGIHFWESALIHELDSNSNILPKNIFIS